MSSSKGSSQDRGQRALEILLQAGELSTPAVLVTAHWVRPHGNMVRLALMEQFENRSVNRGSFVMNQSEALALRDTLLRFFPVGAEDGPRG